MKVAAATLFALLSLTTPAPAFTETASLGSIRAELSYTRHKDGPPTRVSLKVFDNEVQIAGREIPDDRFIQPAGYNTDYKSVKVLDLDGDGIGEAVFDLFTGGAHCCSLTYFYKGATEIEKNFGNAGYRIKRRDLLTGDDHFSYRFGSYAATLRPLQVFQLTSDAKLTDVTRERPARIRKELKRYERYYREAVADFRRDPVYRELIKTSVAAIAADHCNLGDCRKGYALARRAVEKGYVNPRYLPKLKRFLKRRGYDP